MSYYKILGFEKEPFSTSPDPEFFYLSREHEEALTNTLIELRLRRGMSVVLGDVGTGKTTMSRKLVQELRQREDFVFYMILDPSFDNENLLFTSLVRGFNIPLPSGGPVTTLDLKEALEEFLLRKGVAENKTVTLIIDEAQKLNRMSLECLRMLLNYETNEFKLLQLVLLGQLELYSRIMDMPNFFDRISFRYTLNPLGYEETKEMIEFRIKQAGFASNTRFFLDDAVREIQHHTRGYPRQVTMLCHKLLKYLVMRNKVFVDKNVVRKVIEKEAGERWRMRESLLQKSSC